MLHILIGGIVSSKPKSNPFPASGLPRATVDIDVDGTKYLVVGYDLVMPEIEALAIGDPISIQGDLIIERSKTGVITGLHMARTTLPLRRRSINRAPISAMATGY